MGSVNVLAGMVLSLPVFLHLPFHTFYSTWLGLKAMTHRTAYVQPPATTADSDTLWFCVALGNAALPASNQVFLGENHPDATRCSAHIWTTQRVTDPCGGEITYALRLFPADGSGAIQVITPSVVSLDLSNSAELSFDTRTSSLEPNHPVRLNGLPYTSGSCSGANGLHRMEWVIMNTCGDTTVITSLLSLEDCLGPTQQCRGLSSVVVPPSGRVSLFAKDFTTQLIDDCTRSDELLYSFSAEAYVPSKVFECPDICEQGSPAISLTIWVVDGGVDLDCNGEIDWSERNTTSCSTLLVFDDHMDVCDCRFFGGYIRRPNGAGIPEVLVRFLQMSLRDSSMTNNDGWYSRHGLIVNPLITTIIRPERNTDHREGVNTLDLVVLHKHLLGIEIIDNPYQFIAADVNNSWSLSALDLIEMRKLILGVYTEFPKNRSWRFIRADYMFDDTTNMGVNLEEVIATIGMRHVDFVGVKIGDINGSAPHFRETEISTRNRESGIQFQIIDQRVVSGENIIVPVYTGEQHAVLGFQFTLDLHDLEYSGIEPAQLNLSKECVGVHRDAVSMSWFDLNVPDLKNGDPLFYVHLAAKQDGQLSKMLRLTSSVTQAESYFSESDSGIRVGPVALEFQPDMHSESDPALFFYNTPNPFVEMTQIGFELDKETTVLLSVFDLSGREVYRSAGLYSAGQHVMTVTERDIPNAGVYLCKLQTGNVYTTRKMIKLDARK